MISLLLIDGTSLKPSKFYLVIYAICCNDHDNMHKFLGTLPVQTTRWDSMGVVDYKHVVEILRGPTLQHWTLC